MTYGLVAALADDHRGDRLRQAERHWRLTTAGPARPNHDSRRAKIVSGVRQEAGFFLVEAGLRLISRAFPAVLTSPDRR